MRLWGLLLAGALLAAPVSRGWRSVGASLLLYDEQGKVKRELGLGRFRQDLPGGFAFRRTMRGGTSSDGRFAWHWDKKETLKVGRVDQVISSTVTLAYLGTSGQTLWDSDSADSPEGLDPLSQSKNGEAVLVVERSTGGWMVSGVSFAGNVLVEMRASDRVVKLFISANGSYGMVLWGGQEKPLIYTFLNLATGARRDVPAADLPLGVERIGEDGAVRYRKKVLFSLQ